MAEENKGAKEEGAKAEEKTGSEKEIDVNYERIKKVTRFYYKRKDIQKAIFDFSKNREVVPRYYQGFGKRPDMLQYPSDVSAFADKGMTSLHCSEELWRNPLNISNEMKEEDVKEERIGWDLVLDIDCKFLEYSRISASLILDALKFHSINNFNIKFTGGKGFHIFVSSLCFPEQVKGIEIKNFFPEGPRAVAAYLKEFLFKPLGDRILEMSSLKEIKAASGKADKDLLLNGIFNPFSIMELDTVLISPRHLFRMPYSLHEKTSLAAIPLKPEQLRMFRPDWAKPDGFFAKPIEIKGEKNEAKELFVQALDFFSKNKFSLEHEKKEKDSKRLVSYQNKDGKNISDRDFSDSNLKNASIATYPPCINNILKGMREDGRKRALFILLNFFKTLGLEDEEIEKQVYEWNKRNAKPLREGYVKSQLSWYARQKKVLPPNCDKDAYKDIGVCIPDSLCARVKNPVNYVSKKIYFQDRENKSFAKSRVKKKEIKK
jgi:DNA primase catalytic subunit